MQTHKKRQGMVVQGVFPPFPFACHEESKSSGLSSASLFEGQSVDRSRIVAPPPPSLLRRNTTPSSPMINGYGSPTGGHRVSFSLQCNENNAQQRGSVEVKTKVINLPWTDVRGSSAAYTGEVSELFQPHGSGGICQYD
jgi:hypothetical protein